MIKKSMIIGVMLVQGLMVFGAENSLRKSASDLRKSNDKVPSRSCSQEFAKKAATIERIQAVASSGGYMNNPELSWPRANNNLVYYVAPVYYQDFPGAGYCQK